MATRYNNRKIVLTEQTLPLNKILPGMIATFNYSEEGVTDPRPVLLFLYSDKKKKTLEGLNLNYINPTKIKKLFSVVEFKKGKLDEHENLIELKADYFRIQISNPKKRSALSVKRFYGDIVKADKFFKEAYRSYKVNKLTALKVTSIKLDLAGVKLED